MLSSIEFNNQHLRASETLTYNFLTSRTHNTGSSIRLPACNGVRGRRHYHESLSPEYQFKPILRVIPKIEHWQPKKSQIKTYNLQTLDQRKKAVLEKQNAPTTDRFVQAGIRTIYNFKVKENNIQQFSLEDGMQRKKKISTQKPKFRTFGKQRAINLIFPEL